MKAYELAKEVYEDEKATQEAVDVAFGQLQKAIFDLRQIPSKEKLEELIKDVEQMDLTGYTEARWNQHWSLQRKLHLMRMRQVLM